MCPLTPPCPVAIAANILSPSPCCLTACKHATVEPPSAGQLTTAILQFAAESTTQIIIITPASTFPLSRSHSHASTIISCNNFISCSTASNGTQGATQVAPQAAVRISNVKFAQLLPFPEWGSVTDEGAEAFRLCTTIAFLCDSKCFLTCFEDIPNLCFRTRFKFAHLLLLVFPCFPRFSLHLFLLFSVAQGRDYILCVFLFMLHAFQRRTVGGGCRKVREILIVDSGKLQLRLSWLAEKQIILETILILILNVCCPFFNIFKKNSIPILLKYAELLKEGLKYKMKVNSVRH